MNRLEEYLKVCGIAVLTCIAGIVAVTICALIVKATYQIWVDVILR